jgi:hypothetical protein
MITGRQSRARTVSVNKNLLGPWHGCKVIVRLRVTDRTLAVYAENMKSLQKWYDMQEVVGTSWKESFITVVGLKLPTYLGWSRRRSQKATLKMRCYLMGFPIDGTPLQVY